jgi:sterol desaturase/sphingolipid hydroxylase (fatty acid hydroxylase superfamily)
LITAAVACAYGLIVTGTPPGIVVAGVSLALIPICWSMELAVPETPRWRLQQGEFFADLLHMLLSNPIPTAIVRALLFGWIVAASNRITAVIGFDLWPEESPLAIQAMLALLVAELTNYVIHRGLHETRFWPLHAVHHCSPRMYFMISVRKHPLQTVLSYGARLAVLWLLGVTADALALYTVFVTVNSFLQHSNVRMSTGPLGWVLATPELHRIHHSSHADELNCNYGDALILWDRLFQTCRQPDRSRSMHDHIGLADLEVSQTYLAHLRLPFEYARLQASHRTSAGTGTGGRDASA